MASTFLASHHNSFLCRLILAHEALESAGAVNSSVALLLDGPKGRVAVRMAEVGQHVDV